MLLHHRCAALIAAHTTGWWAGGARSMLQQAGGRSVPTAAAAARPAPPAPAWLSASAACQHQQVAGRVLLQRAAAAHGVAAVSGSTAWRRSWGVPAAGATAARRLLLPSSCPPSAGAAADGARTQQRHVACCATPREHRTGGRCFQLPGVPPTTTGMPQLAPRRHSSSSSSNTSGPHQHPQQQQQPSGRLGDALLRRAGVGGNRATGAADASLHGQLPPWHTKRVSDMNQEERLQLLRERLFEAWGEDPGPLVTAGTFRPTCPECGNGAHGDDSFAVTVADDATSALWCCHRASCQFTGRVNLWRSGDLPPEAASRAAAAAAAAAPLPPAPAAPAAAAAAPTPAPAAASPQQQPQQQQVWPPAAAPAAGQRLARPIGSNLTLLSPDVPGHRPLLEWFEGRGISLATLARNAIAVESRYCGPLGGPVDQIAFPFFKNGAIVNVKYRALPKYFSQSRGGEQVFYGFDAARGADEIIIVEGEMDKLSIEEALTAMEAADSSSSSSADDGTDGAPPPLLQPAGSLQQQPPLMPSPLGGRRAVVSVPAGAPGTQGFSPSSLERKFQFIKDGSDILMSAKRVILAVDGDGPGVVLAGELARRLGREKCLIVTWPTSRETSLADPASPASLAGDVARKDANEVLVKDGPAVLAAYINAAKPLPIRGLFRFNDYWEQVYDLYQQGPKGLSWGVSTGWPAVDALYRVVPGELTIVTGLPNSGKSEWLDALAVNLAQQQGWRIALCSLENSPKEHGRKLMEKYTRKAFFDAEYAVGTTKLAYHELVDAMAWLDEHFHLIMPPRDAMPSIEFILERARAAVLRYGITGLIIDPYNELDQRRPGNLSETEHVSRMLTKVKRFAQAYDVHVWFVAHPRTQRGLGLGGGSAALSAPSMYDISGSAHFINKADNGIVVHRPHSGAAAEAEGRDTSATQVLVRKVRNKLAGRIGDVTLRYDRATGRYSDTDALAKQQQQQAQQQPQAAAARAHAAA